MVLVMVEHIHGKPIDLAKLKANVLRDLEGQSSFWTQYAQKLREFTTSVDSCPICGASSGKEAVSIQGFVWLQCDSCTHVYNSRRLAPETRSQFYESLEESINYSDTYTDPEVQTYRLEHVAKSKVDFINQYVETQPASWIDLACGNGDILYFASQLGHQVLGVEPNAACVEYAKEHYDQEVVLSSIEDYQPSESQLFDVVSLLGITDIVPQPNELLGKSAKLLNPKGLMAVEFPNFNSISTMVQNTFSDQIVCRHMFPTVMNMYTFASAELALRNAGLTIETVWWYGMDIYELTTNLTLIKSAVKSSGLYNLLFQNMNDLQLVLDRKQLSDNFMILARKAK